jgi:hypothetical protein
MTELFALNVMWGSFSANGDWYPNPCLSISADDQYISNVDTNPDVMRNYVRNFGLDTWDD